MKIALISSDNNRSSGAFISMANLAKQLSDMGVETIIIIPQKGPYTGPGDGSLLLDEYKLKYYGINSYTWIVNSDLEISIAYRIVKIRHNIINFIASLKLARILKREKVDLVHINTSYSYYSVKSAKKLGLPIVWHIREFLEEDQGVKIWSGKRGLSYFNNANKIIAISNSIKDKYNTLFGDKIKVIYNGIDEKVFYNNKKIIMSKDEAVISYVGGISEGKGVFDIIKACGFLDADLPIRLDIIGRGTASDEQRLKEMISNSNLKYINFLGFTSNVKEVYDRSDIILVTSKAEAFGRVTVEAMLSGCLVIGSNSAGTKELITHKKTGLLYESQNPSSMANEINFAINNKESSKQIAVEGRKYMKDNMTAQINAKNILSVYNKIIKSNNDNVNN